MDYNHNATPVYEGKLNIFKAGMHFDWNIDCYQILCHCDISVNYMPFTTYHSSFTTLPDYNLLLIFGTFEEVGHWIKYNVNFIES